MRNRIKSIVGQSSVYGFGNILIQGANFLLIPVYTRFLSPADFGILSIIGTYVTILLILLKLGQDAALTRYYYDYINDENSRRKYFGSVWIFLTIIALIFILLINWQGEYLFEVFFNGIPFDPYGRLATWTAFAGTAVIVPLTLFRVREKPFQYISLSSARFFTSIILIIFFVVQLKQGAKGSLQGQLIAEGVLFIPLTILTLRSVKLYFDWDQVKSSLTYGLPIVPHQLSGWALNMSDRVILNRFVPLDQVGIYDLGYKFGLVMDIALQSFNLSWSPFFFKIASTEKEAQEEIGKLVTYYIFGVFILGLLTSLLAGEIIKIIAIPAFIKSIDVVPIVVLGFIMHGFYFMSVNQLFYAKQTKLLPVYSLISAGTNILLNLVTIPRFGYIAAAWNTVVGYTILFLLVFRKSYKVYPIPLEYRRICILISTTVITYILGSQVQVSNPYINMSLRLLIISLYPVGLFIFKFFTVGELGIIKELFHKKSND